MINDLWYKNAVVYCLSVATYMDANGDGIGDFKGLVRRLDYLQGMGITAIWLMPFQSSPCRDDGTDADCSVYPLRWVWSTDVGCLPHPAHRYHLAGDLPSDALCPPLS